MAKDKKALLEAQMKKTRDKTRRQNEAALERDDKESYDDSPTIKVPSRPIEEYTKSMTIPDPSKLRRMLNASIGTKKLQPASRVEVLEDLIPKVQNLLDSKNINIKLPSFEASRYERYSVSKTDAEFVMKNTDGDKMAIPTAIRLLKVAGYNPKIVKQLMEAFPVTKLRRARGKSKTAQRSNVQVAKGRVPPPKSQSRSSSPAEKRGAVEAETDRERQAERRKDKTMSDLHDQNHQVLNLENLEQQAPRVESLPYPGLGIRDELMVGGPSPYVKQSKRLRTQ